MVTDTIGNFLATIKNALMRSKKEVELPSSKILVAISEVLKKEGFIEDFSQEAGEYQKVLKLSLRYIEGKPAIKGLKRISKPGVRNYVGYRNIKRVLGGIGINILTTPKGIITGEEAVKSKVGGELLCKVW